MPSIFTKIIKGEIPAYKVAEDEFHFAFLDAFPLKQGHVLVIPKKETDYLFDLGSSDYTNLLLFTSKVALAIKKTIQCKRVSMHVVGLEVPHAHIHLIPINTADDCNFTNEKLQFSKEEFENTAKAITSNF
jgi:histidine triad (HIT) family protein